jgi:hypothetical protein
MGAAGLALPLHIQDERDSLFDPMSAYDQTI